MNSTFKEYELGEICEIQKGLSFKEKDYQSHGIPVLKIKNIYKERIRDDSLSYCNPSQVKDFDAYKIGYEDLVIVNGRGACTGKIGINLTNTEFVFTCDIFKLIPKEGVLSKRYLYYWLVNNPKLIEKHKSGTSVQHIHRSSLEKLKLKIPDLETQEKIVSKLNHFLNLDDELRRELERRKIQHRYYRKQIIGGLCETNKEKQ